MHFIDDDCTLTAEIPAVTGRHGALTLTYRPATAAARYDLFAAQGLVDGKERAKRECTFVQRHLVSWSATLRNGSAAPIALEQLLKLQPDLLGAILSKIVAESQAAEAEAKN